MLIDQINYLYGMLTAADQKPGRDAYQRYDELRAELDAWRGEMNGVVTESDG